MVDRVFPTRRKSEPPPRPIVSFAVVDGQRVEVGTQLVVDGEPGVFSFRYAWLPDKSLAVFGGIAGHEQWRNFPVERCHLPKTRRRWTTPRTEDQLAAMRERIAAARAKLAEKREQ
jgi:hypothetical protein